MTLPQNQTAAPPEEAALRKRITWMKNEQLLRLRKEAEQLYANLTQATSTLSLTTPQRDEVAALRRQVKEVWDLLDQEYSTRVLRGYHNAWKKLLAELQPEAGTEERRIIPLNASCESEHQQDEPEPDPLQEAMTTFADQIRTIMSSGSAAPKQEENASGS